MNELIKIAERYHLPPEIIEEMMQSGGEEFACLDQKAMLIGVRMILGNLFGKEEYFSLEDVCHVTGESKEAVLDLMKESGISPRKSIDCPMVKKGEQRMNEIMNISGIDCYEKDGIAYLKLETVARGLGFTTVATSGNEVVRWNRVEKYLSELGFGTSAERPDFIPENIFYRLAMKAKNEVAEKFQAKIADEVIPSIRRHGMYATPDTVEKMLADPDTTIKLLETIKQERAARMSLEAKAEEDKPKVLFADAVSTAKTSILIGELAKLLKQNGVDIGQNRLFEWLRNNGYLIRRKGTDFNMPTQKAMERGLFEIKETAITHADGHTSVNKTPKVTGKGQQFFVNLFLSN